MNTNQFVKMFETPLSYEIDEATGEQTLLKAEHRISGQLLLTAELTEDGWIFEISSQTAHSRSVDDGYSYYLPITHQQAEELFKEAPKKANLSANEFVALFPHKGWYKAAHYGTEHPIDFARVQLKEDLYLQANRQRDNSWTFFTGMQAEETCITVTETEAIGLYNLFVSKVDSQPAKPLLPVDVEDFIDLFPHKEFIESHGLKTNRYHYASVGLTEKLTLKAEFSDDNTNEDADGWDFELLCKCDNCDSEFTDDISEQEARNLYNNFVLQQTDTDVFESFKRHHYKFDAETEQEHLDCFAEEHKDSLMQFIEQDFRNEGGSFIVLAIPML